MKIVSLRKAIGLLTLICYLAVSSIAAAHAFPELPPLSDSVNSEEENRMMQADSVEMPCHQIKTSVSNRFGADDETNSISACEIFCAAIGNALSQDFAQVEPITRIFSEIEFIQPKFYKGDHSLEPHPPK